MENYKKIVSRRFDPHFLKFGTKINILLLALLIVSILTTTLIGFHYFKVYLVADNYKNLAVFAENKKINIEKDFEAFLSKVPTLLSDDVLSTAGEIVSNFNDFSDSRSEAFGSDSIRQYSADLNEFYESEIIGKIKWNAPELEMIKAKSPKQIVLQKSYILSNPFDYSEKYKLITVSDNTGYSSNHSRIQNKFKIVIDKNRLNNIYIINRRGDVVYNYNKNIAFGANIFNSYLKNTNLATIFQQALSMNRIEGVAVSDFENFIPELNQPVAFMATPLNVDGEKIGVLVLEVKPSFFEAMLYTSIADISGSSVSYQIVGEDRLFRTNDIFQQTKPQNFLNFVSKKAKSGPNFEKAFQTSNGALALSMDKNFSPEVANSYETYNYLGQKVYISSYPLNIKGLDWSIVAMRTNQELLSFFRRVQLKILLVFILVLIISLVLTRFFRESIIHRLNILKYSMSKLAEGINAGTQEIIWHDELGETIEVYNGLNTRINNASDFALHLSEGNYDAQFESQSEKDSFGKALNTLKQKLLNNKTEADKRAKEDTIRNWTNEGIAKFNDLLRQSNNDIKNLSYILIENLVEYLGANLGGVYIVEGESENAREINLVASYAYDRRKYTAKTIEIGEGLIGNCFLEKKPIHLRRIPEDYIEISSGLGKSIPRALYITPLMLDQDVLGFLEIASVEDFEEHKIDFVNKLSENIAATFATVNLNSKTAILLEESKRRSNEIAQQEEEMRQNLEEMLATQEELARIRDEEEQKTMSLKREIENSQALFMQLVNQIEGEVIIKDSSGIVVLVNDKAAQSFTSSPEKLLGKPDSEIFLMDSAEREHESDMQVANDGKFEDDIVKTIDNQEHTYHITKKPFYLPLTSEMGIISIRIRK